MPWGFIGASWDNDAFNEAARDCAAGTKQYTRPHGNDSGFLAARRPDVFPLGGLRKLQK